VFVSDDGVLNDPGQDLVTDDVRVGPHAFALRRPRDPEALLSEEAFADDEFLPYWAELWPSALALADALAAAPALPPLHELGCGLGVPAIVAALAGADVLATDWSGAAIELLQANAAAAGATLDARRWSWTDPPDELGPARPLVVAADVLYEQRNGPALLRRLPGLVADGGEVWLADPGRTFTPEFLMWAMDDWEVDALAHDGPPEVTIHRLRARDDDED
jgi:predicted nicotinamide N-methyase